MNNLKRELAPISTAAWKQIDAEATRVLKLKLAGRKLVDFDGPLGPTAAAVNTGRREPLEPRARRRRRGDPPTGAAPDRAALVLRALARGDGRGRARSGGPGAPAADRRGHSHRLRRGHRDLPRLRGGRHRGHRPGVRPSHPADPRRLPGVSAQHRRGDAAAAPGRRRRPVRHRHGPALLHRAHPGGGRRRLSRAERRAESWSTARSCGRRRSTARSC